MILSVSRRTDIPAFYFDWFLNRLKEGYVMARNPMNYRQVSRVDLSPDEVDCIVFWTKNPAPMLGRLSELEPYPFYIQFSINPYGNEIERRLADKARLVEVFKRLSDSIGPDRMVWRYSPVLINSDYGVLSHLEFFEGLARELEGYTRECKFSFLDVYKKIEKKMKSIGVMELDEALQHDMVSNFMSLAKKYGISLSGCGNIDPVKLGIEPTGCIDGRLISRICGKDVGSDKDPHRRDGCYCAPSFDVGAYDTCLNGCCYCYANGFESVLRKKAASCDLDSPLLCSALEDGDSVSHRKFKQSRKAGIEQLGLF